jgi:SAM-dependent methyltransferase
MTGAAVCLESKFKPVFWLQAVVFTSETANKQLGHQLASSVPDGPMDRWTWDDEFFDAATLTGVLHHFFRPRDSLAEIRRVLRPGGRLLIIDACFFPLVRQIINAALRVAPHDGDCHFYSAREAAALLADLEFEILQTRRLGWGAYFSDDRKPKRG